MLSMLLPENMVDIGKCVQLCLVHDLAEALVGDLTPLDGVSKEDKVQREKDAIEYLVHVPVVRYLYMLQAEDYKIVVGR